MDGKLKRSHGDMAENSHDDWPVNKMIAEMPAVFFWGGTLLTTVIVSVAMRFIVAPGIEMAARYLAQ